MSYDRRNRGGRRCRWRLHFVHVGACVRAGCGGSERLNIFVTRHLSRLTCVLVIRRTRRLAHVGVMAAIGPSPTMHTHGIIIPRVDSSSLHRAGLGFKPAGAVQHPTAAECQAARKALKTLATTRVSTERAQAPDPYERQSLLPR